MAFIETELRPFGHSWVDLRSRTKAGCRVDSHESAKGKDGEQREDEKFTSEIVIHAMCCGFSRRLQNLKRAHEVFGD